jgi:acyl-CoA synthetase (AMP-forming)/AMP-acid ligase II
MAAALERIRPRLPRLRERVSFTGWLAEARDTAPEPLPRVDPRAAAQIQYTSGTTGTPKGAVLHHRGLVTNATFVAARAGFTRDGVWGTALPLFHTAGCDLTVLGAATATGTLVLVQVFQPTLVLEALQQRRVTFFAGVPAMLSALLNHPSFGAYDLSACSAVLSGGDRVPPDLVEETELRFGARFSTLYGQTELSPAVTQTGAEDSIQDKLNIAGRPLWQVEVKIAGPAEADPLPVGEPGEICARGYQVMLGYHDLPEATAQTIDRDGWLRTGHDHPRWGEHPPTAAELHDHLRAILAPHKTPRHWYLADALPANAMGKIQKFLLRRQISDGRLQPLT